MKPLSEALLDLASRVQNLETSTKTRFENDRADLQKSLDEIGAGLDRDLHEFDAAVRQADAAGSTWWNETQQSIARQLEDARSRYHREAEVELEKAKPTGDAAEVDANAAVALANYALAVAEYSIADAALKGVNPNQTAEPAAVPTAAASN